METKGYVEYLIVKNNIILNHIIGRKPIEIQEDGLEYIYGRNFKVSLMEDIRKYKDIYTGEIKPLEQQVKEGIYKLPEGKKIVNNKEEDMTEVEKVETGILKLKPTQKIENGVITEKTYEERLKENLITVEEYNKYIDKQRQYAYQNETDGIGWEVLEGRKTKEEWITAKEIIKKKFPKVSLEVK